MFVFDIEILAIMLPELPPWATINIWQTGPLARVAFRGATELVVTPKTSLPNIKTKHWHWKEEEEKKKLSPVLTTMGLIVFFCDGPWT